MPKIRATLLDFDVIPDKFYPDLYQRGFGEKINNVYKLDLFEACYLVEKGKLDVYLDRKKLDFNELIEIGKKWIDNFWIKYLVYRDLRERGLYPKAALKYGADFRVYEKEPGEKKGENRLHAKYLVKVYQEDIKLDLHDLAALVRVAHSTRKVLLLAIVDRDGDITYYQISWHRFK